MLRLLRERLIGEGLPPEAAAEVFLRADAFRHQADHTLKPVAKEEAARSLREVEEVMATLRKERFAKAGPA